MARYKPGAYKAPKPQEIEVEGLGTFLVKPLSNREQDTIQKEVIKKDSENDVEHAGRLGYAYMAASLVEPKMTAAQVEAEVDSWTMRQGSRFVEQVQIAAHVIDGEDLDAVKRRFRQEND